MRKHLTRQALYPLLRSAEAFLTAHILKLAAQTRVAFLYSGMAAYVTAEKSFD